VHANITYPNGIFAWYLQKTQHIPYLVTEHWTVYLPVNKKLLTPVIRFFSKLIIRNAAYVTPVSNDLKNAMRQLAPKARYQVIPNVVNTNLFVPKKSSNAKKQILHVSTLKDDHKNISGILETIKALHGERHDFTLKIVGDGDITPHRQYAQQLGLGNDIVTFEGEKTIEEIAVLMQQSDVFLLFSNYENLPCVIIEAISSGIPVVSSNVGGISEMLDDETGILVEPKNNKMLKKALHTVLDNLSRYDKQKMHEKARNTYSEEVIGKAFLNLYQNILTQPET
jgi:glycosyltransferase involved in cell wall biosynthesis